jgi:hypothetical protein
MKKEKHVQFITCPLEKWPRPATAKRTWGNYGVDYTKCLNLLERELNHLQATGDVIIQIDMPEGGIRRDGLPYADKKPNSPRVAISFTSKHGPLVYYCDAHHDWRDNVRAIVLGLERLRLVERTGVISRGEQYTGFKALPPGVPLGPATMTVEEAAAVVFSKAVDKRAEKKMATAADLIADPLIYRTIARRAALVLHPDTPGGDRVEWDRFQSAADVLKKHHGIS